MARKYFGDINPIGEILTLENQFDLTVTGIARDVPHNTDIQFEFVSPFPLINEISDYDYLGACNAYNFVAYLLVNQNFSLVEFEERTIPFYKKYSPRYNPVESRIPPLTLQPISSFHLSADLKLYMYIFSAIALIILALACINYTNLATVLNSLRIREVGLRKVFSANRTHIFAQLLGESLIFSIIALPIAMIVVEFILSVYNRMFNFHLDIQYIRDWRFSLLLIGIAFCVGIISGIYPALFTSIKRPIQSLDSSFETRSHRSVLRNILVVFQFSVSTILIIMTLIIHHQMHYIQHKNIGFEKDQVINITLYDQDLGNRWDILKTRLLAHPDILFVSGNNMLRTLWNNTIYWEGKNENDNMNMRFFYCR